jgi:hypothetical protein
VQSSRHLVFVCSLIGLGLTALLLVAMSGDGPGFGGGAFLVVVSSPFLAALLSLVVREIRRQRWVWLTASLLTVVSGFFLAFNGVGIFFLAIALAYGWAFFATAPKRSIRS